MQLFGYCTKQIYRKLLPSGQEQMRPALPSEISTVTSHGIINELYGEAGIRNPETESGTGTRINDIGSVYTPVRALMKPTQTTFRIVFFVPVITFHF